jgi:hypothetical protein
MTLVERYLSAVRFFLPRRQQDDIVRELSENLTSDIEARSDALGRELTEIEVADILRRHGHPVVVAGRYGQRQQLIGPVFFPIYLLALKIGLGAAAVVTVVVAVIGAAWRGASVPHLLDGLLAFPERALIVFAWTTAGFAVLDMIGTRAQLKPDWDPRKIPDWMVGARRQPRHARFNSLVELVFGFVGLAWMLSVPASPWFAMGPLAAVLDFAPVWRTWYVPLVVVTAVQLAVDVHALVWPTPDRRRTSVKLALLGAQLVVALSILSAQVWVVVKPGVTTLGNHRAAEIVQWVNVGFGIGCGVVIVVTIIEIGKQYYRLRTSGNVVNAEQ